MGNPEGAGEDALQFDQAEYVAPQARACGMCRAAATDQYFTINGKTLCSGCHARVQAAFAQGSPGRRFLTALGWGGGGALLGAAIYYSIRVATGYEIGLVAIIVGILVGKGVSRGAGGRGGLGYPILAVALTYLSIVLTYVPEAVGAWGQHAAGGAFASVVFGVIMFGITLAAPVLVGIKAPLSLVIVGFALYEAWKITRRSALVISGPFVIAPGQPRAPSSAAPIDTAADGG